MASTARALRRRCPVCKKLRGFREPDGSQGGEPHPQRKPWAKVNGVWICGWCAGTPLGADGPGTVPHGFGSAKAARWEEVTLPGSPAKMYELRLGAVSLYIHACTHQVSGSWMMRSQHPVESKTAEGAQAEMETIAEHSLALALRELRAFMRGGKR